MTDIAAVSEVELERHPRHLTETIGVRLAGSGADRLSADVQQRVAAMWDDLFGGWGE